jgi:asparagine synthase (glutamine-hydrolysing)
VYAERRIAAGEAARAMFRTTGAAVARAIEGRPAKELGAFLSGGTDSSTVVGLLTRLTGEPANAFSIGFAEDRYNELHWAEVTARHFGAAHATRLVTPAEALGALPRLVEAFDEPFGNNSALGTYHCALLARERGVTRLLAGDGGDEIFGGNERYRTDRIFALYHRLPSPLRRAVVEPVLAALPDGGGSVLGLAQRYVRRAKLPNPRRFYSYQFFFAQHAGEWLAPDFVAAVVPEAPVAVLDALWADARAAAELNRLLHLDLRLTLGDNDLLKVTRTADLAGVGVRFPLLDVELVELMATLPARFKVRGLEKRHLFRRAFRDLLPAATLAKRKQGFGVPTSLWLKHHPEFAALARDTLLGATARRRGWFRPGALERLFALHAADTTPFYGDLLWTVLALELWQRRWADAGGRA